MHLILLQRAKVAVVALALALLVVVVAALEVDSLVHASLALVGNPRVQAGDCHVPLTSAASGIQAVRAATPFSLSTTCS